MRIRAALTLCSLVLAGACGGDGVLDPVVPPGGNAPTLSSLQSSIFTPKCAVPGCHLDPGAEQGMDLSAGKTWAHTVGVGVTELPGYERVVAGSSADSYLYMKIAADPRIVGVQMPFGGMLTAGEIEAVRAWIDAGAENN
jgi:hypothetical protein